MGDINMKIGCLIMIPCGSAFLGIQCAKGRGKILPGGTYEPGKDKTYQDAAVRECQEEMGVTPTHPRYIWHGPDGGDCITFAFRSEYYSGEPIATPEGTPVIASWGDLFDSAFGAYYRILHEIVQSKRAW